MFKKAKQRARPEGTEHILLQPTTVTLVCYKRLQSHYLMVEGDVAGRK
jgi:hypothetical protein